MSELRGDAKKWLGARNIGIVLSEYTTEISYMLAEFAQQQREAGRLEGLREAVTISREQRCERGTPWELACTTISQAIKAKIAEGHTHNFVPPANDDEQQCDQNCRDKWHICSVCKNSRDQIAEGE